MKAGAIPLVRSNAPQGGQSLTSTNHVYGAGLNPHNFKRTVGGSNGADAAMVVSKCVPFSIGCDHIGSMKYSAAFNGAVALKMSRNRTTNDGISFPNRVRYESFNHLQFTTGPIGTSVSDCVLGTKVQLDADVQFADPNLKPSEWNEDAFLAAQDVSDIKPKIGILQDSPFLPTGAAVKRAVYYAEFTLKRLGYEVVPFFLTDEVWR